MNYLFTKVFTSEYDFIALDSSERDIKGINQTYIIQLYKLNNKYIVIEKFQSLLSNKKKYLSNEFKFYTEKEAIDWVISRYELIKKKLISL